MICLGPVCIPVYQLLPLLGLAVYHLRYYFLLVFSKIFGFAAPEHPSASGSTAAIVVDDTRIAAISQVRNTV